MAHSARNWKGARTPQAIKRDRQAERRHAVNQPRESAARTLVAKALRSALAGDTDAVATAIPAAEAALDRAAKTGAIHPNAAARRKSRLMRKVNAALAGAAVVGTARATKSTGRAAAAKAAKARVAASRASKSKGEQTAVGKARAAVQRATRGEPTTAPAEQPTTGTAAPPASTTRTRAPRAPRTTKAAGEKAAAEKAAPTEQTTPKPRTRTRKQPEA